MRIPGAYRRMIRSAKPAVLPFLVVLFSGCGGNVNGSEQEAKDILKSEKQGDFRGVNMGDNIESVMEKEEASAVYSMPDELVYRIPKDEKENTWYEISYNFNAEGLYDINLEVVCPSDSSRTALVRDFREYYSSRYGNSQEGRHRTQWRTMTASGKFVSVLLIDSIQKSSKPAIRVNYNEHIQKHE